jgi:glycosyltransferase involved in cell wall biosynthesis
MTTVVSGLRVAVFAGAFPPALLAGGPIRTLDALVHQGKEHHELMVVTSDRDLGQSVRLPVASNEWTERDGADVMYLSTNSLPRIARGMWAIRRRKAGVLYLNSFFHPVFSILPLLLARFGFWGSATRLLAPRGEFGEGALRRRAPKKRLYIGLFRLLRLHKGLIWHASSEDEARDIRRIWGPNAVVMVREDETLLPELAIDPVRPAAGSPLRLLFLARIVEHKGLDIALKALADLNEPIEIRIYGPEEDRPYGELCRRLASDLPNNIVASFFGPAEPDQLPDIFAATDILILPTAGENFGHVIAEALAHSCAVMTSASTPWTGVLNSGGGIVVPHRDVEAWALAFEQAAGIDPDSRFRARLAAQRAYDQWKSEEKAPHIFDQLADRIG